MNMLESVPSTEVVPALAAERERVNHESQRSQLLRDYEGVSVTPKSQTRLETNLALAGYDCSRQTPVSHLSDMKAALERGDAVHFPHPAGFTMEWSGCEFVCRGALLENDPQRERLRVRLFDREGRSYSYEIKASLNGLNDESQLDAPYNRAIRATSSRVHESDGLYPLLKLSWEERLSPVIIPAISHEQRAQQFENALATNENLKIIPKPDTRLVEHIGRLGVSGENYHIVQHQSLNLGFVIPTQPSHGVLIIGLDDSGLPRPLPAYDQWKTSASSVSSAMQEMDFRIIFPDGTDTFGFRGSVPHDKEVAGFLFNHHMFAPQGRMLQQIQEFSTSAEQQLEKRKEESFAFSLARFVSEERKTARQEMFELADNLNNSFTRSHSFAGSVQKTNAGGESESTNTPLHLLNQLEAVCRHGLREVSPTGMTLQIWDGMGINPDSKRSFERTDKNVKIDMSASSSIPSYSLYIMPDVVGREPIPSIKSALASELKSDFTIDSQPAFAGGQIAIHTSSLSDVVRILQYIESKEGSTGRRSAA